jgi:hypothetical protein
VKNTQERQKFAQDNLIYSERRMDLLLISISGAGIYVCLETVKYLSEKNIPTHWLIWVAGISFLAAIITNFIGQFFGYKANYYDYLFCQSEMEVENEPTRKQKLEIKKFDKKAADYNKLVFPINVFCTMFMFIGLSSIVLWFLLIF